MKVINKLVCFFSVLVLCLSFLCFNVSAQSASLVESDIVCNYSKLSSMESKYKSSPYVRVADLYNHKVNNGEDIPFHFFDTSDPLGCLNAFTNSFGAYYSGFTSFDVTFDIGKNSDFYYVLYHGTSVQGSYGSGYGSVLIASSSPFHLVDGKYVSDSGDNIYILFLNYQSCSNDVYNFDSYNLSKYTFKYDSEHNTALKPYFSFQNHGSAYTTYVYTFSSVYSNIDDLSFPDGYEFSKVPGTESLSEQIEVKLTPAFSIDMDRVFDQNTGQNDYFKLQVTNNSDSNIQFYCAIVDPGVKTLYNDNGQVSDFAFNHSYWNYIHDSEYYQMDSKVESKYLGFATTTTFYANKLAGNIFWIILKSGETFEDYIYWENVKIMPTTSYDFVCEACPTPNDIVSDMFVSSTDQLEKQFYMTGGSHSHWWTISEGVEVDQSVEQYALESSTICEVYRINFSVLTIPEFSNIVRGGNSKITSGWEDTQAQASNPYYKQNLMTGQIEGIENYQEFKGKLSDVDVDLDNVGIDDIKGYITYSQSFFSLLKSVFQCFPALWIIIVFGLTAIIVIAIVRYVRG